MQQGQRFLDSFGFHWEVLEIESPGAAHPALGDGRGWLYFISRGWTRVTRDYPREWEHLDWAELEEICARAMPLSGSRLTHTGLPARERPRAGLY